MHAKRQHDVSGGERARALAQLVRVCSHPARDSLDGRSQVWHNDGSWPWSRILQLRGDIGWQTGCIAILATEHATQHVLC
mmetsp:Transcript_12155/g.20755  ORF Transcript_12155/g.20755 Transcript_12155/m.20755 type:complete len:80 (-) Transcript_12155:230-469(-)